LKNLDETKGMALLTVLLFTVLLIIMAVSMIFISTNFLALFGSSEARLKALEAAEAGVEYALYRLNDDPNWGNASLAFGSSPNPDAIPTCYPASTDFTDTLADGSKFTITFDCNDARYGSENNLFGTTPTLITKTPPYTAKIVSIGRDPGSNVKKVMLAYLVRGDLYPYTINSEGMVILNAGEYTIKGEGAGTNSPGHIYSSWVSTPAPDNYSIEGKADAPNITNYGGMFVGNGPINIAGTFDGYSIPNHPQNFYFSNIDVGKIVERARSDEYGDLDPNLYPGLVKIMDESIDPESAGYQKPDLIIDAGGTGFDGAITIDQDKQTLLLTRDVFIEGDPAAIDANDRFKDWSLLVGGANIFRILRSGDMKMEETAEVVYHPPKPPPGPNMPPVAGFFEVIPQDDTARYVRLNLNGHDIYSFSHLMLGVEVIGTGRIVSYGKIACLMSVNPEDDITIISGDDLTIELSQSVEESHNKGFYYALDDVIIEPMGDASYLMAGADDGNTEKVCNYYSTGHILTSITGSPNRTGIGYYDPDPNTDKYWKKDYEGSGVIVRKVTPPGGGVSYLTVEADDEWHHDEELEFCLEYTTPYTQINLGENRIKIALPTGAVSIIDPNDTPLVEPFPSGLTQAQLDVFGEQIRADFSAGVTNYDINMKATVSAFNKYKNVNSAHTENESVFNTDSLAGKFTLEPNISYMKNIINIERKTFTVRKAVSYELE